MYNEFIYPTHNTLTFSGRKIKPIFSKYINDLMYQVTELEGAYRYEDQGKKTRFTIYPENFEFGEDPSEINSHLEIYKNIYEYVVSENPECFDI